MEQMFAGNSNAFALLSAARKLIAALALGFLFTACQKDNDENPGTGTPGNPGTPPPAENYFAAKVNMKLDYQTTDDDGPVNHSMTVTGIKDSAGGKVIHYKSVYANGTATNPYIYTENGAFTLVNTPPGELNEAIEEIKNNPDIHDFSLTGLPLLQKLPANPQAGQAVAFSEPMHMGYSIVDEGASFRIDMYFGFEQGVVAGFEDVTTQAGTFKSCLKVQFKTVLTLESPAGNNETVANVTQWYAKGIGMVKTTESGSGTNSTTTLTGITGK